jgi:hypothetical protein
LTLTHRQPRSGTVAANGRRKSAAMCGIDCGKRDAVGLQCLKITLAPFDGASLVAKTIVQSVEFPVPPPTICQPYVDAGRHAAAIAWGGPGRFHRRRGGQVRIGSCIRGRFVALVPTRLNVQTRRASDWRRSDQDSLLVLGLEKSRRGTGLRMTHVDVPDGQFSYSDARLARVPLAARSVPSSDANDIEPHETPAVVRLQSTVSLATFRVALEEPCPTSSISSESMRP